MGNRIEKPEDFKTYRALTEGTSFVEWLKFTFRHWRNFQWVWQRITRGYSDSDLWDFDTYVTSRIRNAFKAFVRYQETQGMSTPEEFESDPAAWLTILQKIEKAFDLHHFETNDPVGFYEMYTDDTASKQIDEGLALFGKYYQDFWD